MDWFTGDPEGPEARDGPDVFDEASHAGAEPDTEDTVAVALRSVASGLSQLQAAGFDRLPDDGLRNAITEVEQVARRIAAVQVEVLDAVDRRGLYQVDGHSSAKVMVRNVCRLSNSEAAARDRARRTLRDLPGVADAYRSGDVGTCQVRLIGRVHANPRVRDAMAGQQDDLINEAAGKSYVDFERLLRAWERLVDQDGTADRNERNHRNRDAKLVQDPFGLGWDLSGQFGALQGAQMREVFDHYIEAEWLRDWEAARAEHGDAATAADLARSDRQRRADALAQIFADAASQQPGSTGPGLVHNIVWDADTYFALLAGLDPDTPDTGGADTPDLSDADRRWCETLDGIPLEPREAAASSLAASVRRVLVNTAGVVVDLGRKARLFTGSARLAVKLQARHCIWPGCWVPTSRCEADHLQPHTQAGPTNPTNGAPLCGRHNRWKQKGYTTWRDPNGNWHTHRPDGTEIA